MQNFTGTWKMKSSENFDELLKALGEDKLLFLTLRCEFIQRFFFSNITENECSILVSGLLSFITLIKLKCITLK